MADFSSKTGSIVERLLAQAPDNVAIQDAAAEIERLERELENKADIAESDLAMENQRLRAAYDKMNEDWADLLAQTTDTDVENRRLRAALDDIRSVAKLRENGSTHWDGCEAQHPLCWITRRIEALAHEPGEKP